MVHPCWSWSRNYRLHRIHIVCMRNCIAPEMFGPSLMMSPPPMHQIREECHSKNAGLWRRRQFLCFCNKVENCWLLWGEWANFRHTSDWMEWQNRGSIFGVACAVQNTPNILSTMSHCVTLDISIWWHQQTNWSHVFLWYGKRERKDDKLVPCPLCSHHILLEWWSWCTIEKN